MTDEPSASLIVAAGAFARPFYAERHRAYHNEQHVRAVLAALSERHVATGTLALAVWGHDLIYDPRATDNEERSAEAFDAWLKSVGARQELRDEVRGLILATRHVAMPAGRTEALLVDADLSILGADDDAFDAYDVAIRSEYAHIPNDRYREGRKRVLAGFLARDRIFTTPEFAGLEGRARGNLGRALGRLEVLPWP
jgi:predicted metal-dependent HD superfamily phosphohydrolase